MDPIRVLLVDDHGLVRAGIRAILKDLDGIEVIAEAGDGREALRLMQHQRPDVVLMDIAMRGLNGLDATLQVKKDFSSVHVLILSMYANKEYVIRALYAGATGYLLKDTGIVELERAIRAVAVGETYLDPAVSKYIVADYLRRLDGSSDDKNTPDAPNLEALSVRQREILQLIAEGHTTKQIAALLHLGVKTVETHRLQLMQRLDVHEITGLVRYAIRTGLVVLDG